MSGFVCLAIWPPVWLSFSHLPVCLPVHFSVCLFALLSSSDSADTDTVLMWQFHSLETVHPVHKSSATVRRHRVNLIQTLKDSHPFVFSVCLQLQQQLVLGFEPVAEVWNHAEFLACIEMWCTQGRVHRWCVISISAWHYFPCSARGVGKGPGRGLWSIHPHPRLCNHFIAMSKGIKELFIHSLCWARLIDYGYSQYVSSSAWPCIPDLSVSSACCVRAVWKKLTETHKVKFDNILI